MESTQRSPGRRPHKVRCAQDAQVWASLAALPCSSSPNHDFGSWLGSRGLRPYDFRTRGARLENGLNLFGAGVNLGPFRPPPAAARIYQIHVFPLFPLAPLVYLAFSDLFGRGRPMWRPAVGRDDSARRVVTITPPHPSSPSAMPPSPLGGEGLLGAFYRLPPLGGKLASEARLMRGRTVEGREILRPRARYFPWMESTQRSPGRRPRKLRFTRNAQAWASRAERTLRRRGWVGI